MNETGNGERVPGNGASGPSDNPARPGGNPPRTNGNPLRSNGNPPGPNGDPFGSSGEPPIETGLMQVTVQTEYASDHSSPQAWRYVFVYQIRIENIGGVRAQLFWRHWHIHDPVAGDQEVQGEGVVGETPWLSPGDVHEYQSFCVLRGPMGHMEGFYHFRREDGSLFRSPIPRFFFQAPPNATGSYLA
jgi:ApaG protein